METREILEAVAAGRMSASEAEQALGASEADVDAAPSGDAAGAEAGGGAEPGAGPGAAAGFRVKVTATARAVRIIGDPSVAEASVEGRHRADRVGETLIVDGSVQAGDESGFSFEGRGGWHRQWLQWRQFTEPLVVRVNSAAVVDVEMSAGSLTVQGVSGPLSVVLAAGSARLDDVTGPFDLETRAGAVRISGRIESHQSRIRCEAGQVSLHLSRGSSAVVRARAELGRVRMFGSPLSEPLVDGYRVATVGGGAGSVQIDATMGSVEVYSDEWSA